MARSEISIPWNRLQIPCLRNSRSARPAPQASDSPDSKVRLRSRNTALSPRPRVGRKTERGIMSTVCSKNDFEAVRDVLKTHEVWDYFIFPSVNWEPKGPRLQSLIETIQLRPETVMLIDDNPMNRNEALFFVPSMQVADETVIPQLLSNPLFKGRDDRALTRLQQYPAAAI